MRGWYADMVLQHGRERGKGDATGGSSGDIRARGTLVSLETGGPAVPPGGRWTAEPKSTPIAAHRHIGDADLLGPRCAVSRGNTVTRAPGPAGMKGDCAGRHGAASSPAALELPQRPAGQSMRSP